MAETLQRKINVLEVCSTLHYGGGQRNMVTFVKYLRQDIFSITVGVYADGGPLEKTLQELGIGVVVGHNRIEPLLDVVKNEAIDILHIHRSGGEVAIETALIQGAKKINPNLVVVEKNVFGKYDPTVASVMDCSLFQSMMHLNERYLPASGETFNFDKQKVFYNLVDGDEFSAYRASPAAIAEYRAKLGIRPTDFVIGKVARPVLEKWSDLLIDMVPYLVKEVPHAIIIIIGCPPSRIKRINRSRYKDLFRILPETDDQRALHLFYQTIDVLAHSSKIGECNGNTINEAMFWKKPVVVNSTPRKDNGQLEQVIHKVNGIVANTPPTFARALASLAADPAVREKMGQAGFDQVKKVNDSRFITKQLEKVFIEKMDEKSDLISLPMVSEYATVPYYPSETAIVRYQQEYHTRLGWEFGRISSGERLFSLVTLPCRLYYKIKDFVQHKWQSHGGR